MRTHWLLEEAVQLSGSWPQQCGLPARSRQSLSNLSARTASWVAVRMRWVPPRKPSRSVPGAGQQKPLLQAQPRRSLNNLGIRYSEVGRRQDALGAGRKRSSCTGSLPAVTRPSCATWPRALNNLDLRYSERVSRRERELPGRNDPGRRTGRRRLPAHKRASRAATGHQAAALAGPGAQRRTVNRRWSPRYMNRRVVTGPPTRPVLTIWQHHAGAAVPPGSRWTLSYSTPPKRGSTPKIYGRKRLPRRSPELLEPTPMWQ